jgi:hypothetical protein
MKTDREDAPVIVESRERYCASLRYLTPSRSDKIQASSTRFSGDDRHLSRVLFCDRVRACSGTQGHVPKMHQRSVAYKGFLICMVLFCTYMQWSPVVDLDYVWINGHEHYVGAASPHQPGKMVLPNVTQAGGAIFEDFAPRFQSLPSARSATRLAPSTTLRL